MAHLVEEKQHARLSPSATKRWMTCPGSVGLIAKLNIPNKSSRFAAEGTAAHEVHELCLLNNQRAEEYRGKTIEADGFKFKVNQDMIDAVQESLDYIHDLVAMAESAGQRVEIRVEVRCSLKSLGIKGMDGGTSDVVLIFWEEHVDGTEFIAAIEVFDYKHGQGVAVEAEENTQAMSYALGVLLIPEFRAYDIPDGVAVTISQPRAHHPQGRIRSWVTDKDHIVKWGNEVLVPAAKATMEPDAAFVASEDACRFCDAAGQCPKLFAKTQEVAMLDFADDEEPQLPDVQTLTADQKRFIMDHGAMLRSFIVAVENQVKHEVDHGSQDYEGYYKLVRKTTRRKFTADAFDELCSPLLDHLQEDDLFEQKARSMTEVERRLKKAIGPKNAKEVMDEVTTKPEGELVIAPESDKRKGVPPAIMTDFEDLGD